MPSTEFTSVVRPDQRRRQHRRIAGNQVLSGLLNSGCSSSLAMDTCLLAEVRQAITMPSTAIDGREDSGGPRQTGPAIVPRTPSWDSRPPRKGFKYDTDKAILLTT